MATAGYNADRINPTHRGVAGCAPKATGSAIRLTVDLRHLDRQLTPTG